MATPHTPRAITIIVMAAIAISSVFLILNGLYMLIDPRSWYDAIPGVVETGFYNPHFVRDIGIVQLFLGLAFAAGLRLPGPRLALWSGATTWLVAHALFHFWEVATGICAPAALLRDFAAVTLPALIGISASLWAWRNRAYVSR